MFKRLIEWDVNLILCFLRNEYLREKVFFFLWKVIGKLLIVNELLLIVWVVIFIENIGIYVLIYCLGEIYFFGFVGLVVFDVRILRGFLVWCK